MLDRLGKEININDAILHCDDGFLHLGIVVESTEKWIKYAYVGTSISRVYQVRKSHKVVVVDVPPNNPMQNYAGYRYAKSTFSEEISYALFLYKKSKDDQGS